MAQSSDSLMTKSLMLTEWEAQRETERETERETARETAWETARRRGRRSGRKSGRRSGKVLMLMGAESRDDVTFENVMAMWQRWRRGGAGISTE